MGDAFSPKLIVVMVAQRGGQMWRCCNRASPCLPLAKERHTSSLDSLLKMRILEGVPPVVVLPLVVPPSYAKPVLVLNLILIWQVHPFLTCSSSLLSVLKSTISNRNWRHLVCIIIAGSKFSLVEFGGSIPPHFVQSVFCS